MDLQWQQAGKDHIPLEYIDGLDIKQQRKIQLYYITIIKTHHALHESLMPSPFEFLLDDNDNDSSDLDKEVEEQEHSSKR